MISTAVEDVPVELLDRTMQLTPSARKKFGNLLLESVAEEGSARALIHARIAKLVSGEAVVLDADEVLDELECRYAQDQ